MIDSEMMFSKSKMNLFGDPEALGKVPFSCAHLFKLTYIDKLPIPQPPNMAFAIGLCVHSFIEKFYDNIKIVDGKILVNEKLEKVETPDLKAYEMIRNFMDFEQQRLTSMLQKGYPISYFYPVLSENVIKNPEIKMQGIVDRVDKIPGIDEYIVIDNKTGKFGNYSKDKYFKQELIFYKILIDSKKMLPKPIKYVGGYFPLENDVFSAEVTEEEIEEVKQRIEAIRECIRKGEFPKNKKNCRWCPAKGVFCTGV